MRTVNKKIINALIIFYYSYFKMLVGLITIYVIGLMVKNLYWFHYIGIVIGLICFVGYDLFRTMLK